MALRVSVSSLKCFKSCRRMYWLKYTEGLEPVQKPEAIETGANYHKKIEEIYKNGYCTVDDNSKESAMALAYEKFIYPQFKMKSVEDWFEYDVGNDIVLVGRTDGISEDGCLVEHKTTSSELEEYEFGLQWDEQILAYMLAKGMRKIYYTIIRKPTIRQKKNESDEEFFDRMCQWYNEDTDKKIKVIEIVRTDEEVERFKNDLMVACDDIIKNGEIEDRCYKNTMNCTKWGRMCDYAPVCLNYDRSQTYVEFMKKERNHDGN